jgi:tetratricopeptide (TPR) repeat protein
MVTLATTSVGTEASAQKPAPSAQAEKKPEARAAELYEKSAEAYKRGEFSAAVDLLKEAYGLDPQPVLLYNLARAYEGLGDLDHAIDGYERYLAQSPKAEDRGSIEQRILTLRRMRDERAALVKQNEQKKKEQPPPPPPPPKKEHTIYPYVVGGAGAVGLVVGGVLGLSALSHRSDARSEPVQTRAQDLDSSAQSLATASTVSFVIGGLLVAAGVTWWILESPYVQTSGSTR